MIDELCSHILDVAVNSITAGSRNIGVTINEDHERSLLTIIISDDGKGMDAGMIEKVQDPFFSTKEGRKVGLGIPLLKETAEETGGTFHMESAPGKGVKIKATFDLNHPDLPVLGNLKDTIFVLVVSNPDVDFIFRYVSEKNKFYFNTKEVKRELQNIPINHPDVVNWLREYFYRSLP